MLLAIAGAFINSWNMKFLEKDLEQIIYEQFTLDPSKLAERNLPIFKGKMYRQLRIGNYGIADLINIHRDYNYIFNDEGEVIRTFPHLVINIIELKKDRIGISAFLQSVNYLKGIKSFLNKRRCVRIEFNIMLIGSEVDTTGSFSYLTDLIQNNDEDPYGRISSLKFYTYKYDLDGLYFIRQNNYTILKEGF